MLESLSTRLRGETAQRVLPARGTASAAGGGGGADETPPREVVHLRQLTAQIQKEKHDAGAAMVKLELDIRDAVRERDCVNQNRARMLWRRIAARGSRCTLVPSVHSIDSFGVGSHKVKALLAVTEECGPDVSVGFGTIVVLQPHLDAPEAAVFVAPLERVGENLLRYNVLDLRRVAVHFRQIVVVSLIPGSSSAWAVRSSTVSWLRRSHSMIGSWLIWYGSQEFSSATYP